MPLAAIAARLPDLSRVCLAFTPATLLRWHHEIVRRKWTFDNRRKQGRPPLSAAVSFENCIRRLFSL